MQKKSLSPIIVIRDENLVPNAVAEAIQIEESRNGYKPNRILNYANIFIDEEFNNWQFLNSTFQNHQSHTHKISLINSEKEATFKIHVLEDLLLALDNHPPIKPTYPPLDWPYCFLAQLSIAAETKGMSPEELFEIFCIELKAPFENTWMSFKWKENLQLDYYPLSLKREGHNARLQ